MQKFARIAFTTLLLSGFALPTVAQDAVIQLTPEQQTTVIQDFSTVEVPAADVDLTVGAAVPTTVTLQPVPETVVKVVPGYSKYKFFKAKSGAILIVEPTSMKVVAVLK